MYLNKIFISIFFIKRRYFSRELSITQIDKVNCDAESIVASSMSVDLNWQSLYQYFGIENACWIVYIHFIFHLASKQVTWLKLNEKPEAYACISSWYPHSDSLQPPSFSLSTENGCRDYKFRIYWLFRSIHEIVSIVSTVCITKISTFPWCLEGCHRSRCER